MNGGRSNTGQEANIHITHLFAHLTGRDGAAFIFDLADFDLGFTASLRLHRAFWRFADLVPDLLEGLYTHLSVHLVH